MAAPVKAWPGSRLPLARAPRWQSACAACCSSAICMPPASARQTAWSGFAKRPPATDNGPPGRVVHPATSQW